MVVANAVAALSEINEASQSGQPLVGEFCLFIYLTWSSSIILFSRLKEMILNINRSLLVQV